MVVGATEKDSNKYQPEVQEQTVNQGDIPKAEDSISNKDKLPEGTKYEFVDPTTGDSTRPDTSQPGTLTPNVKVTYPDGSSEIVGPATIIVEKNKPEKPDVEPIKEGDETVKVKVPTDGDKVIVELPDGTKVEAEKDPDGNWTATETDPDGTPKTDPDTGDPIVKPVEVNEDGRLEIPVDPTKVVPGDKPVEVTVKDSETGKESDPTEVKVVAIPKELERIKLSVANLYEGIKGITATTNPEEAKILIYKDDEVVAKGYTDALGNATIILTKDMVLGEKYRIVASKDGYLPNEITMIVK